MRARILWPGIFAATLLLFLMASCKVEDGYAVEISGEQVSYGEYMIYLYEQKQMFETIGGEDIWETDFDGVPAEEFAKQKALDSLLYVKLAARQAESRDLSLTEEENAETETQVQKFLEQTKAYYPFTQEEVRAAMRQRKLYEKIYEEITAAVETDSQDLKKQFYDSNFEKWLENVTVNKNDEWISQVDVKKPIYEQQKI